MKISILSMFALLMASTVLFAQHKEIIYYNSGQHQLDQKQLSKLEKCFSAKIESKSDVYLTVKGFTDLSGNAEVNKELSEKRAQTVAQFFQDKGMAANRVNIQAMGEGTNGSASQNRRVEVIVYGENKKGPRKLSCVKERKGQIFKRSAQSDIAITAREGTQLIIPSNSLTYPNGELVEGDVEIEVQEYYNNSDILKANLNTLNNDEILESGGMVNLRVTANGQDLQLTEGSSATLRMPTEEAKDEMQLYKGMELANGAVNWELPTTENRKAMEKKTRIDSVCLGRRRIIPGGDRGFKHATEYLYSTYERLWKETEVEYYEVNLSTVWPTDASNMTYEDSINFNAFGYINCDRIADPERRQAIVARNNAQTEAAKDHKDVAVRTTGGWRLSLDGMHKERGVPTVQVVFNEIKTTIPLRLMYDNEGGIANQFLRKLPPGYTATVIAYEASENSDQIFLATQEISTNDNVQLDLELKAVSIDEFNQTLAKLN